MKDEVVTFEVETYVLTWNATPGNDLDSCLNVKSTNLFISGTEMEESYRLGMNG